MPHKDLNLRQNTITTLKENLQLLQKKNILTFLLHLMEKYLQKQHINQEKRILSWLLMQLIKRLNLIKTEVAIADLTFY